MGGLAGAGYRPIQLGGFMLHGRLTERRRLAIQTPVRLDRSAPCHMTAVPGIESAVLVVGSHVLGQGF